MVTAVNGCYVKGHESRKPNDGYDLWQVRVPADLADPAGFLAMNAIRPDWGKVNNC